MATLLRLSVSVCAECIVAKRFVLEQKLVVTIGSLRSGFLDYATYATYGSCVKFYATHVTYATQRNIFRMILRKQRKI